jgi:predicted RNA binding protein YcfA (HicA-like mRNA interferase family)
MTFRELVRKLEAADFRLVRENGSVRFYKKAGWPNLVSIHYHGNKEVPSGTCRAILKGAGLKN